MSKPKDLVSEKDYDKKKAKIISQTTGKPIAIDYGKYGRENFVMKDTAKNGFIGFLNRLGGLFLLICYFSIRYVCIQKRRKVLFLLVF